MSIILCILFIIGAIAIFVFAIKGIINRKHHNDIKFKKDRKNLIILTIFTLICGILIEFTSNDHASSDTASSSSSSIKSSSNQMSAAAVDDALEPLKKDSDLIDSFKVIGFDTDGAGGTVIIKTVDLNNIITKDKINNIIVKVCQLLAKNPQVAGTGVNIKITSLDTDNGNYVVTGYAHVDSKQFANVNSDNVSTTTQDYQNNGQ